MAMPRALAAYWRRKRGGKKRRLRKLKRGSAVNRRLKRRIGTMSRRRYGRRRRGHRGKKGIIFGMGLLDIGQLGMTIGLMGAPEAAQKAMSGDFQGAAGQIATSTTDNIVPIVVNNMIFGFTRKIISRFAPKAMKRFL